MKKKYVIGLMLAAVACVIIVVIVIILMRGETKTSGQNPANVKGQSLVCESRSNIYPFFKYNSSNANDLKITANFYDNILSAISLVYTLYYNNMDQVTASEAHNHAAMNISFGENGLEADALNAHYTKLEESLKMNLYATATEISPITTKYFMLNAKEANDIPLTLVEYQKNYEMQGFTCRTDN